MHGHTYILMHRRLNENVITFARHLECRKLNLYPCFPPRGCIHSFIHTFTVLAVALLLVFSSHHHKPL